MDGIVIDINPMALHIGHFMLNWYSIIVILAIIAAVVVSIREGKRKGISSETIYALAPWVLIGGILGARLFHVIDRWEYYAGNPLQIFAFWQGGLAIWGALAGGGLAAVIFARRRQIPFGRLVDTLVPGLLVAQIIGRFACIIDGDAVGGPTTFPWGFIYTNPDAMVPAGLLGVPLHPYPVYDQLWNLIGLAIALKLRHHLKTDGLLFLSYLSIYAVGRFIFTFVRQEKIWFWGLQEAQVIAVAIILVSLAVIIYKWRKSEIYKRRRSEEVT
ncbi:MAG: prolipoprotein diacylglyceryl transferase [Chloroflexi bacterium RBG_16_50_9]|nr:MAG: prolipoprotein diacylglyceryl transferase [Chloroflexi bacterium RBG_16_50_9]